MTADRRAAEQISMLERRGATVLHGPAIRTHPVAVGRDLAGALDAVVARPPAVTVLSTGIGVRGFIEAAEALGRAEALVEALAASRVYARGPQAHGAAVTAGIAVHWSSPSGVSDEILAELGRSGIAGVRVAVQLDGARHQPLAERLLALGADVVAIPWHTRTKTGRVEILDGLAPAGWVEIDPADARRYQVHGGDLVRLVSERGAIDRIRVRVTRTVREGEVFVPFHFDEQCANRLTINEFDPISRSRTTSSAQSGWRRRPDAERATGGYG
ncbi:MAG TPA: molybdopterin dinucleotide binding domain-containing protein [Acidimicrobiales bacterium]|nr:molybdopterin dinucleotide binding domain-containing protein [Acidimicrobiales bacterium]